MTLFRTAHRGPFLPIVLLVLLAGHSVGAQQQTQETPPPSSSEHRFDGLRFLAGAALGLVIHESGHLAFDLAFDAHPRLKRVSLAGLPFFAVVHRADLSPRRAFIVSAAGFWMQDLTSERLLVKRPSLRSEDAPMTKGEFAFDELTAIGYGIIAFANAGRPGQQIIDTRAMADAIRVSQPLIGGIVIAPALLDGYRYFDPDARWAKWASRAIKAGSLLLILK
jgi:hypothetical protein